MSVRVSQPWKSTRVLRSDCISIMPDGTTKIFRKGAASRIPKSATIKSVVAARKMPEVAKLPSIHIGADDSN